MENTPCCTCLKSKAPLSCGICESSLCKYCTQYMDEGNLSFLSTIPADLNHLTYCVYCYDSKVAPALAKYTEDVQKAKDILVFSKDQKKETRLIKRIEEPVKVEDCPDEHETLMRLAFFAVQAGYNAIIDVDIKSEKIRSGSYQTTKWRGTGVPAHVIESKLLRDKAFSSNPN